MDLLHRLLGAGAAGALAGALSFACAAAAPRPPGHGHGRRLGQEASAVRFRHRYLPGPPVPAGVARRLVVARERLPVRAGEAVQVVDHLAVAQRQLADELLLRPQARRRTSRRSRSCPFSTRSTATSARAPTERWPSSSCLISRAGFQVERDHVVQRHPHGQELAHHVEHVLHARVHAADVQVGRDGVGEEALLDRRHRDAPGEAAAAVADVEDHAALAALARGRGSRGPSRPARRAGPSTCGCRCRPGRSFFVTQLGRPAARACWRRSRPSPGCSPRVPASTARSTGVHSGPA